MAAGRGQILGQTLDPAAEVATEREEACFDGIQQLLSR
jgi:hypothetical protein